MSPSAVELRNVTKRFESVIALNDVSLQIDRNEVFGLLGPNGAGKSTLLDLLVGFRVPTTGSIRVLQIDPQDRPRAVRQRVGILPDAIAVNPNWSGRRHLEFVIDAVGTEETPETALERVELCDAIDKQAGTYSKGMRRRLVLSMSLVGSPDVLLLDEPSTGVDPGGMEVIRDVITQEQDNGASIVFSSHRLEQVSMVADRVGILVDGELVEINRLDAVGDTAHSLLQILVETPPSSLANVTAIDGVSDAQAHLNRIEVVCSDRTKKRVLDVIEDECGSINNITVQETSLEDSFLDIIE